VGSLHDIESIQYFHSNVAGGLMIDLESSIINPQQNILIQGLRAALMMTCILPTQFLNLILYDGSYKTAKSIIW
jgi:hypothetical protein